MCSRVIHIVGSSMHILAQAGFPVVFLIIKNYWCFQLGNICCASCLFHLPPFSILLSLLSPRRLTSTDCLPPCPLVSGCSWVGTWEAPAEDWRAWGHSFIPHTNTPFLLSPVQGVAALHPTSSAPAHSRLPNTIPYSDCPLPPRPGARSNFLLLLVPAGFPIPFLLP